MTALPVGLATHLDELLGLSQRFSLLLQRELQALARWPVEGLHEIAREKLQLAEQLRAAETRRSTCLLEAGWTDTGLRHLADTLPTLPGGQALRERVSALLALVTRCHADNQLAGTTIQLQARQTLRGLELLSAQRGLAVTYGADGIGRLGRSSSRLGAA